jgi:hypothetical protein
VIVREGAIVRAFISYSRRDKKITDEVCKELTARGHTVWRDVTSIPGGADWRASIEKGIVDSDAFVMLISHHVVEGPDYAREELDCARHYDKPIMPVYLAAVAELPNGFNLTLSGRQRIDLYPSFRIGMERLLEQLDDGQGPVDDDSRHQLELRSWATDNAERLRKGAHKLRLEAKQRELGKKAMKIGGLLAAGAVAAAAASAKSRDNAQKEAEARQASDSQAMLAVYRRKIKDSIERCAGELGRLVESSNPADAYEREFRPELSYVLGQLDATEPPIEQVPAHRRLVESLSETLNQLDRAMLELQRGDDDGARRALERMAEQFIRTLQQYGELLGS